MIHQISEQVGEIVEQRRRGLEQMRDLHRSPILPTSVPDADADEVIHPS